MEILKSVWEEGVGLLVDDGALAALCAGLIALLSLGVWLGQLPGLYAGVILLLGCIAILAWSVRRAVRSR